MDISQFARIIDALPVNSRLILLGDRHQLASVQAGCVMADICNAFSTNQFSKAFAKCVNQAIIKPENRIQPSDADAALSPVVELQYSYRFQDCKPIGVVSKAVNSGSAEDTISKLSALQPEDEYCRLTPYPGQTEMADLILKKYQPLFDVLLPDKAQKLSDQPSVPGKFRTAPDTRSIPEKALAELQNFMVLTVLNEGPYGREGINQQVYRSYGTTPPVRPIKITENSISHNLFNGDMGVIIREKTADGETIERAWFPFMSDGETAVSDVKADRGPRQFLVGALPAFVDAFAITIHNSQGSEFDQVAVVLPFRDMQLLTRELLYTGITRAKTKAVIYGAEDLVKAAVGREIDRHSGLEARIRQ
jgi:exodeoxyribonuclease V alpha subunit